MGFSAPLETPTNTNNSVTTSLSIHSFIDHLNDQLKATQLQNISKDRHSIYSPTLANKKHSSGIRAFGRKKLSGVAPRNPQAQAPRQAPPILAASLDQQPPPSKLTTNAPYPPKHSHKLSWSSFYSLLHQVQQNPRNMAHLRQGIPQ
jgi:hypothetical protein